MKSFKTLLSYLFLLGLLTGCYEDMDDVPRKADVLEINDFIWKGMNNIYLYKADVPDLADDRFATQAELNEFLKNFTSPENLFFDGLLAPQDNFSFMTDDYIALEKSLDGIGITNGMQFGLLRFSGASNRVIGYVRYVLPNTSAEENGIKRGDFFTAIDGQELNTDNFAQLLEPRTYALQLSEMSDSGLVPSREVTLTKVEYSTNPVLVAKTIPVDNGKVGYLMYNGFTSTYDATLNETFGMFQSEGITDLIVDLRYNGGGSVETASDLGSMITGQFEGEVFSREEWNDDYQTYFEENNPERLINRFNNKISTGATINSLNLSRVFVITTLRTASASELLINGLEPYIEVIQIGAATTGKFQASTTLYDSPDFNRREANPAHTYAIQPLIYKSLNANGVTDYHDGLQPDLEITENITNLGIIGDSKEPLLEAALNYLEGNTEPKSRYQKDPYHLIWESGMEDKLYKTMYTEKKPPVM